MQHGLRLAGAAGPIQRAAPDGAHLAGRKRLWSIDKAQCAAGHEELRDWLLPVRNATAWMAGRERWRWRRCRPIQSSARSTSQRVPVSGSM
jgi:hypothetical protein